MIFDFIGVGSALIFSYVLKFKLPHVALLLWNVQFGVVQEHAQIEPYLSSLWMIVMLSYLWVIFFKGYRPSVGVLPEVDELFMVVKSMTGLVVSIILIQFFDPLIPGSRMVMVYFWLISIAIVFVFRLIILKIESYVYSKGIGARRTLIIGTSMLSQDIAERMIMYPAMGYYYVGFLDDAPPEKIHFHLNDRFHLLGSPDDYQSVCIASKIESIFLIKRDIAHIKQRELIQFSLDHGIQLNVLSEPILDTPFIDARVFDGMPMISTTNFDHRVIEQWVKRLGDIIVSSLALVVLFPVFVMVSIWIKWVSPKGPILFKQTRVGQHGQLFHMIKFRSMIPNAEASTGPVMVDELGDARYIKGGQFIRQFSLDELPQFWNVLWGQMSLVGPRPERPHFVDQFSKIVPYFNERHVVPVGMSGWAQINGRSVLTRRPEHKIKYDIYYINHWSVLFDIKILIKTLFVVFSREESY